MVTGPATLVVFLVTGALLALGAWVVIGNRRRCARGGAGGLPARPGPCRACGHENSAGARYCARCGAALRGNTE
jgi:hypothetical protein